MRQEEKKTKDKDPQKEEDASASSPPEEEGLGLNAHRKPKLIIMTFDLKRSAREALFCLISLFLLSSSVFALDRRESAALSHYITGGVYAQSGQIKEAIGEYRQALKADFKNSRLHFDLACALIRNREFDKAVSELKLAISFDSEAIEAHTLLALLYSSQNKAKEAAVEYELALSNAAKIDPRNIDIYRDLGSLYLQQKKFKEAQKVYAILLELSPSDPEAHFYLGDIYNELKDPEASKRELKAAIALKPDYAQALNYLGYLYVEEGKNLSEAEALIRKALGVEPDNGAFVDSLGWLYFKQGKLEEAVKELERASALFEDPEIYAHLGEAYLKIGNIDKAKENWQKSLKLEPGADTIKKKLQLIK